MNLEKHVTSLELSQRLKSLGVPQESAFYWTRKWNGFAGGYDGESRGRVLVYQDVEPTKDAEPISAFLASELGEMLLLKDKHLITRLGSGGWYVEIHELEPFVLECVTEADARAKLLIHLIEQKIVDPKTLTPSS